MGPPFPYSCEGALDCLQGQLRQGRDVHIAAKSNSESYDLSGVQCLDQLSTVTCLRSPRRLAEVTFSNILYVSKLSQTARIEFWNGFPKKRKLGKGPLNVVQQTAIESCPQWSRGNFHAKTKRARDQVTTQPLHTARINQDAHNLELAI